MIGPSATGDNDAKNLAPGLFDVIAHGGWKTGSATQVKGDGCLIITGKISSIHHMQNSAHLAEKWPK